MWKLLFVLMFLTGDGILESPLFFVFVDMSWKLNYKTYLFLYEVFQELFCSVVNCFASVVKIFLGGSHMVKGLIWLFSICGG